MQNFKQSSATRSLLYAAAFLIPFYFFRIRFGFISTNFFEIFVLFSLISFLFQAPREFLNRRLWVSLIILAIISVIAILVSPDKYHALGIAKGWFLAPAVFGWLVYKNFDQKNLFKLAIPLFISVLVVAVWALLQKLGIVDTRFYQAGNDSFDQYVTQGRAFGPFESPNYLAMFLVPTSVLSLLMLEAIRSKIGKATVAFSLVLPLLAVYFSGSRAGVIATVIAVALYFNYRYVNKRWATEKRPFRWAVFVTGWVVASVAYFIYSLYLVKNPIGGDAVRIDIYKYSFQMLEKGKHFIFGIGLGDFQAELMTLALPDLFKEIGLNYALHPHNLLLAMWLNLGLLGLAGFVFVVTLFLKWCYESKSLVRAALIAAMFAMLVHGFFDTTYFKNDLSAIFWLLIAGSLILHREKKHEKNI